MKKIFTFLLTTLVLLTIKAQSQDFGTEWSAGANFDVRRNWQIDIGEEVRFNQNSTRLSKCESEVGFNYSLLKDRIDIYGWKLKVGGSYAFLWRYNSDNYYEPQHRLNLTLKISKEIGHWKLNSRTRWQTTFRDEDRVSVRYNPKMYLREMLQINYAYPDKPWGFYADEECFYRLNDPEGLFIDEWRTRLGVSYRLSRDNSVNAYFKISKEVQVKDPNTFYSVGLGYEFN